MNNKAIVSNIKALCKEHNTTISQLEKDLFLSPGLISRWAKNMPTLDRLMDIASYFNTSIDSIVKDSNEIVSSNSQTTQQLLSVLYNRSLTAEIEWEILNKTNWPNEFDALSTKDMLLLQQGDCFFTGINNGFFFLSINHDPEENYAFTLYALADRFSSLSTIAVNLPMLRNLYTYLMRRYANTLANLKTQNFVQSVLDTFAQTESASTEEKAKIIKPTNFVMNS